MEGFFQRAKDAIPNVCMGTDLMVGFPGETEINFEETCVNFMKLPLSYCHVFTYSERDGTPAAKQSNHVPMDERRQRSARLRRLSASKRMNFHEEHIGKQVNVLLENPKHDAYAGYTENYLKVVVPQNPTGLENLFAEVEITEARPEYCIGKLVRWENQ